MGNRRRWAVPAVIVAAAAIGWGADAENDGGALYTPTRAEWLCVLLNVDRAVTDGSQFASSGMGARYRFDHTHPNTVQIELLYPARASRRAVRYRAEQAEEQAHKLAKLKGWDVWLKTEIIETRIASRPFMEPLEE